MHLENRKRAGLFLFLGAAEFAVGMSVAESVYPRYSVAHDFLGDLGLGPSANVFNVSIILFGLTLLAAAWFLFRSFQDRRLAAVVSLAGAGLVGFGTIPAIEAYPTIEVHTALAFGAYLFGGLAPIVAARFVRPPFRYVSIVLGAASLVALAFVVIQAYPVLDRGGMERMILWPFLIWGMAFGGTLAVRNSTVTKSVPAGPPNS